MKIIPILKQQFEDDNGVPLAGGQLYTYQANSLIPKATYADSAGVALNTNPVVLDAAGRAAVFCDIGLYKFVLQDSNGNTIYTLDNIRIEPVDPTAELLADMTPSIVGKRSAPQAIALATGVQFVGTVWDNSWYVQGSGGAIDFASVGAANPQIAAATNVGQELMLICTSDTNTLFFRDGNGLDLNGDFLMKAGFWLWLKWDGTKWSELDRGAR